MGKGNRCKDAALFQGAAPITLINGERLLDLLIEHGVGVKDEQITLREIDGEYLAKAEGEAELDDEA